MRKNIKKKQYVITAVAGLTLLLVFGGTAIHFGRKEDPSPKEDTTPSIEIDGGDIDWEFDPTKEITITPVPEKEDPPKEPEEIPDEDGNLSLNPGEDEEPIKNPTQDLTPIPPEENEPETNPDLVVDVTPTPIEEPQVDDTPKEQPTLAPTPTPIEKETTPAPTPIEKETTPAPTPIEKETTPVPTPVEKQTTPAPTKAPEKFVEKKNPTLEEDGYTFDDPTGYKVGEVVETVIPVSSGEPLDCIHHQPGDVFAQALDGLERNATYVERCGDDGTWIQIGEHTKEIGGNLYTDKLMQKGLELVCYGKYPEELIKKYYADDLVYFIDENGIAIGTYFKGKYEATDKAYSLEEIINTNPNMTEAAYVPPSGVHVGNFN